MDALSDENKKLSRKNFELARALAAAQRQLAQQQDILQEECERNRAWLLAMQDELELLAASLIEAQEAWAEQQASRC